MENRKKIAAVVSGVFAFIKAQEEMAYMQAASLPAAGQILPKAAGPVAPINLWGMSGRQAQMQMRNTMQLKGFHGLKIK